MEGRRAPLGLFIFLTIPPRAALVPLRQAQGLSARWPWAGLLQAVGLIFGATFNQTQPPTHRKFRLAFPREPTAAVRRSDAPTLRRSITLSAGC